jgi:hypothetical protein
LPNIDEIIGDKIPQKVGKGREQALAQQKQS